MKPFGAFIPAKNFFSTIFDRRNGVAALTPLLFTNELAANIPSTYLVTVAHGKLAGIAGKQEVLGGPTDTAIYRGSFGQAVTNLLTPLEKLQFATIAESNQPFFGFKGFKVTIGGTTDWDGGDLLFYLGDQQVGKVLAATLLLGAPGSSKTINVVPPQNIVLGTGTYSALNGIDITVPSNFNIRLSAPTTVFNGIIWVEVITESQSGECGTWCAGACDYPINTAALYCGVDKCKYCQGVPGFSSL